MCRALKVLCVAPDASALDALRRATVSAEWELAPGASSQDEALARLHEERPHVLVVFGAFPGLVERALEAYPFLRVIVDRRTPGAVVVGSIDDVRGAVKGSGGPVRS
ncbi:MAG TPA: hypothetical protein VFM40_06000 [Actinomycetota bacterium]|nr:hypothetical protein [Actinomycetota bacterium]